MILQFQKYVPAHPKSAHIPNQSWPSQQPEFHSEVVQDTVVI